MLVLTRNVTQNIIIGDNEIKIKILRIRGHQVAIGIEAPRDITVDREEIYLQRKQDKIDGVTR